MGDANLQVNLYTTVLVLLVLAISVVKTSHYKSADKICFQWMIQSTIIYCISVSFAVLVDGTSEPWSKAIVHIANMLKVEGMTAICVCWFFYVIARLKIELKVWQRVVAFIPFAIATILILINPFTDVVFDVSAENVYARGVGVYIHWGIGILYMAISAIIVVVRIRKTESRMQKKELAPLLIFLVFPALAALFQIVVYGIYSTQAGFMLGMIMIFILNNRSQIRVDSLTGLNNSRERDNYIEGLLSSKENLTLTVICFDLENFKQINEKKGRVVGDKVLISAANVLKKTCDAMQEEVFLCRRLDDEFLIIGNDLSIDAAAKIRGLVRENSHEATEESGGLYTISFAIGETYGDCKSFKDFNDLIEDANRNLRENKMLNKIS